MESRSPTIAAIGVIGRSNNPLHISLFPAVASGPNGRDEPRDKLEYSFMLNTSLDIFEARAQTKTIGHDFGLLQALDERIAMYGWLTNTGVKLVIVVDMEGRPADQRDAGKSAILGLRNSDLTPVSIAVCSTAFHGLTDVSQAFQALQTAYIRLLRNPFYNPDDHDPRINKTVGSLQITSPNFIKEVDRIGRSWYPGNPTL